MAENTQVAVRPRASQQLATLIGMNADAMLDTIKAQCFKTAPGNVSDAQLAAFVSIAADMGVNPLLPGMLYAYPISGGGIVPIMGPDGIYKKLTEHPDIDSWETEVFPADVALPPTHAVTRIWRKGRDKPLAYTAVFSEWKINSNPNWNTRPRHMLALRSLKHAARQLIHGLPGDEDDRHIMNEINVTPGVAEAEKQAEAQQKRADAPARSSKGAKAANEAANKGAINVETVPPKPETPPPAQEKPAEKAAEKVPEKPAEKVAEKIDPPKTVEKPAEQSSGARTGLKEGEEITVDVTVKQVYALNINKEGSPTPSINAKVEGQFVGQVYHFGAAIKSADGLSAPPEWKEGSQLRLTLFGRINKKTLSVLAEVKKLELAEGSSDNSIDV